MLLPAAKDAEEFQRHVGAERFAIDADLPVFDIDLDMREMAERRLGRGSVIGANKWREKQKQSDGAMKAAHTLVIVYAIAWGWKEKSPGCTSGASSGFA
jgi:hypothetical protein